MEQSKKILRSASQPLVKVLSQFKCETVSLYKWQVLVAMVEDTNFSVDQVLRESRAMSFIAKWVLGIIQQRSLQLNLEPIVNKNQG